MSNPITLAQQHSILSSIRSLVPNGVKNCNDRRAPYLVGAIVALQAIDSGLVPQVWLNHAMNNSTQALFRERAEGEQS